MHYLLCSVRNKAESALCRGFVSTALVQEVSLWALKFGTVI